MYSEWSLKDLLAETKSFIRITKNYFSYKIVTSFFRKLRCSVYHCMEHWVQLTNSLPEEGSVVNKLMSLILDDIRPLTSQTKVKLWNTWQGLQMALQLTYTSTEQLCYKDTKTIYDLKTWQLGFSRSQPVFLKYLSVLKVVYSWVNHFWVTSPVMCIDNQLTNSICNLPVNERVDSLGCHSVLKQSLHLGYCDSLLHP